MLRLIELVVAVAMVVVGVLVLVQQRHAPKTAPPVRCAVLWAIARNASDSLYVAVARPECVR